MDLVAALGVPLGEGLPGEDGAHPTLAEQRTIARSVVERLALYRHLPGSQTGGDGVGNPGCAVSRNGRRPRLPGMSTHTILDSPVGELTLVAEDGALTGVYFPHHWTRPDRTAFGPRADFPEARAQLAEYFAGERREFDLPTRAPGDELERAVGAEISRVPYGATTTYGEIATAVRALPRDVGGAVGRNPLSIVVACHRVVGRDGKLTGYAGGLERKRFLLELEQPPPEDRGQLW